MIVRISTEGQYTLPDGEAERLNELERAVVSVVEEGREGDFQQAYSALLDQVRANGALVGDDELSGSDLILPPPDMSFEEAGREFTGEGLIPD